MKKLSSVFGLVTIGLVLSLGCSDKSSDPVVVRHLLAHWTFEEGSGNALIDISGRGHNGVIYGNPQWTTGVGCNGTALSLDGVDDYVDIPIQTDLLFKDQSVTFTAWVQIPDNSENGPMFIALVDADDGAPRIQLLKRRAGSLNGCYNMQLQATTVEYNALSDDDGNLLPKNTWTHLAGVLDFATKRTKLYVNGVPQQESSNQFDSYDMSLASNLVMNLGIWRDGDKHACMLDEIRVYNYALSAEEVQNLFLNDGGE